MNQLYRLGTAALLPAKIGEKWVGPIVSRRKANIFRKRALRNGTYGTIVQDPVTKKAVGGWDPAWDWDMMKPPAPRVLRPPKFHKNERNRAERAQKITAKLEEQGKRMEELRKKRQVVEEKIEPGIMGIIRAYDKTGKVPRR